MVLASPSVIVLILTFRLIHVPSNSSETQQPWLAIPRGSQLLTSACNSNRALQARTSQVPPPPHRGLGEYK